MLWTLLLLFTPPTPRSDEAPDPPTRFIFADLDGDTTPNDIVLWPFNLHLGYGVTSDAAGSGGGLAFGADIATLNYDALSVDTLSLRGVFRDTCGHQRPDCGLSADLFLGSRVGYARYWYPDRLVQGALGLGVGVGEVGSGWSGRDPVRGVQAVLSPSARLSFRNFFGLELSALLPMTGPMGAHYPTTVMINVMGGGVLALSVLR